MPSPPCPYLTPARADGAQMGLGVPSYPPSPLELALSVLTAAIQVKYLALVPGGLAVSMGKVCDTQVTISNPKHLGHFFPSKGNKHKGRTLPDGEEAAAPSTLPAWRLLGESRERHFREMIWICPSSHKSCACPHSQEWLTGF